MKAFCKAAIGVAFATLFCGSSIAAQTEVDPRDFISELEGRTAWFRSLDGALVGIERFEGDGSTLWLRSNGSCTRGRITYEDGALCFRYEDSPSELHCWRTFRDGERLVVVEATAGLSVQVIDRISNAPLDCAAPDAGV
ncbi:hypothetical protein [Roseobacter sp. HKCCA0434]|uniref:hypothetical protein n=1 Tax=Roseobacter sp. HKCCA0434 TaxID=3079297 RepID=UPI002905ABDF|nr:hypothetical protein [Roseobacter sp. HKCCA0434]